MGAAVTETRWASPPSRRRIARQPSRLSPESSACRRGPSAPRTSAPSSFAASRPSAVAAAPGPCSSSSDGEAWSMRNLSSRQRNTRPREANAADTPAHAARSSSARSIEIEYKLSSATEKISGTGRGTGSGAPPTAPRSSSTRRRAVGDGTSQEAKKRTRSVSSDLYFQAISHRPCPQECRIGANTPIPTCGTRCISPLSTSGRCPPGAETRDRSSRS